MDTSSIAVMLISVVVSGSGYHLARTQGYNDTFTVNKYGATALVAVLLPYSISGLYITYIHKLPGFPDIENSTNGVSVELSASLPTKYLFYSLFLATCLFLSLLIGNLLKSWADKTAERLESYRIFAGPIIQNCHRSIVCHMKDGSVVEGTLVYCNRNDGDVMAGDIAMVRANWVRSSSKRLKSKKYPEKIRQDLEIGAEFGAELVTVIGSREIASLEYVSLGIVEPEYLSARFQRRTFRDWMHLIRNLFSGPNTIGG